LFSKLRDLPREELGQGEAWCGLAAVDLNSMPVSRSAADAGALEILNSISHKFRAESTSCELGETIAGGQTICRIWNARLGKRLAPVYVRNLGNIGLDHLAVAAIGVADIRATRKRARGQCSCTLENIAYV